jgi:hypothetical protein
VHTFAGLFVCGEKRERISEGKRSEHRDPRVPEETRQICFSLLSFYISHTMMVFEYKPFKKKGWLA